MLDLTFQNIPIFLISEVGQALLQKHEVSQKQMEEFQRALEQQVDLQCLMFRHLEISFMKKKKKKKLIHIYQSM